MLLKISGGQIMKLFYTIAFSFLVISSSFGQKTNFDLKKIKYRGLDFILTKEQIINTFGNPKVEYPRYECGGYTDDLPGGPYYQLTYPTVTYIGSDKETFTLEKVQFDTAGKTKLLYNGKILSGLTTLDDFVKIFGDYVKEHFEQNPTNDGIILMDNDSDDGGRFLFLNGRLVLFEYWTPC